MSKYAFAIKNAADLLNKAKYDSDRFNDRSNDHVTWTYAAIDYIQTAWHLAEWIAEEAGVSKTDVRTEIDTLCNGYFMLIGDLANGQKHFQRASDNPPRVTAKTSAPVPKRRLTTFMLTANYRESPFVIDDTGKKIYAQILIRDSLSAIEKFMRASGITME